MTKKFLTLKRLDGEPIFRAESENAMVESNGTPGIEAVA